jgi:CRP-like cAMP-binding protein
VEFGQRSQNNRLLAGLSPEALSLLRKHLREEELKAGAPLWQVGHPVEYIYFPVCGMISIGVPTDDGHRVEVAIVGREGAVGFWTELGMLAVATQAATHTSARFLRRPAGRAEDEFSNTRYEPRDELPPSYQPSRYSEDPIAYWLEKTG